LEEKEGEHKWVEGHTRDSEVIESVTSTFSFPAAMPMKEAVGRECRGRNRKVFCGGLHLLVARRFPATHDWQSSVLEAAHCRTVALASRYYITYRKEKPVTKHVLSGTGTPTPIPPTTPYSLSILPSTLYSLDTDSVVK
jgi:hypothetical protein